MKTYDCKNTLLFNIMRDHGGDFYVFVFMSRPAYSHLYDSYFWFDKRQIIYSGTRRFIRDFFFAA